MHWKRKLANDIKLQESFPVDENLRPLKVGGKTTAIETAQHGDGAKVNGDLTVTGNIRNGNVLRLSGGTMTGDLLHDNGDFLIKSKDGDLKLDASGGDVIISMAGDEAMTIDVSGNPNFKIWEAAGTNTDYFNISVVSAGATVLSTVDVAGEDGHFKLDIDGEIHFDSASGKFKILNNSTEFSVADSSYAGMILGYRTVGINQGHATYSLTTSFAVPDSGMTVRFIAPPSGVVEVEIQIGYDSGSSTNRILYFGLSDNATYNALQAYYEQVAWKADETDDVTVTYKWVVTGLTPGDTYNYWLGAKINNTTGTPKLQWGGNGALRFQDFIMKVTALPTAVSDFAVYG